MVINTEEKTNVNHVLKSDWCPLSHPSVVQVWSSYFYICKLGEEF